MFCRHREDPLGGARDSGSFPGDAARSPCPCELVGRGQAASAPYPTPGPPFVLPGPSPAEGSSWDMALAVSPRKFWSWTCPYLRPRSMASSVQLSPAPGTQSSRTGPRRWDTAEGLCPHRPARCPHPRAPSIRRARRWRGLCSGCCCTGDGAQSFLPSSRKTFFNRGKQSGGLAVLMRGGQLTASSRPQGRQCPCPLSSPASAAFSGPGTRCWLDHSGGGHGRSISAAPGCGMRRDPAVWDDWPPRAGRAAFPRLPLINGRGG